jgi:hypothetical protein
MGLQRLKCSRSFLRKCEGLVASMPILPPTRCQVVSPGLISAGNVRGVMRAAGSVKTSWRIQRSRGPPSWAL